MNSASANQFRVAHPELPQVWLSDRGECFSSLAKVLAMCVALSGCAAVGGTSKYACKAPDGVRCQSVSGTYHNAVQRNLPSQQKNSGRMRAAPKFQEASEHGAGGVRTLGLRAVALPDEEPGVAATAPLRSRSEVLRMWYKPWQDADRDLHDQGYVYVQVKDSEWLVEHAQQRARQAYLPIKPPRALASAPKAQSPAGPPHSQQPQTAAPTSESSDQTSSVVDTLNALRQQPGQQ